jgi:micrococcal nuclease
LLSFSIINLSCNYNNAQKGQEIQEGYFVVKKVVDGDTFYIDNGTLKGEKIRLIGVDAPESRNTFRKKVGNYGNQAKAFVTNLLTGKSVKLEFDIEHTDQYGRTLAYVYLESGFFLNAELVKQGYAMVMTVPPNVKYVEEFVKLQQEARENERGLWKEKSNY